MEGKTVKFILKEGDLATAWYNIVPDLPVRPEPPLNPKTLEPLRPEDLEPIFPMSLIEQEVTTAHTVDIPGQVLDVYRMWRPTPLYRARKLESALGAPVRIYYKYEGVSPVGSHKPNTAVAQAYYNKKAGTKRLSTETGAGQWGAALAMACAQFGLECLVYMVRASYDLKPYRRSLMRVYGAEVFASPSLNTAAGRAVLEKDPDSLGSLGIAISEALEVAAEDPNTKYSLGSVLNHVMLHQTVIGMEAIRQMEMAGDAPDYVVACCGGGSNFAGLAFPFLKAALKNGTRGQNPTIIAVEPAACPTLTRGAYAYDFGDTAGMAPVIKMHTLGHGFIPAGIHAGGLRYHGVSPLISILLEHGYIEARAVKQLAVFEAATLFAKTEGILPAPESAHAIRTAIDLALKAKEKGEEKCILFGLSGHGNLDLASYELYYTSRLVDYAHPEAELERALSELPKAR
ncbi:MAG: TrpB-like pyridoxal phosphate-dependent enzyme [Bacillota bacterium]|jgi:tryptophan synthase beta chain